MRGRTNLVEELFAATLDALRPRQPVLSLFGVALEDRWRNRNGELLRLRDSLDRRLKELRARKHRLVDACLHRDLIDEDTFREEQDLIVAEINAAVLAREKTRETVDLPSVLRFAERFLSNLSDLWREPPSPKKRLLQDFVYPDGLPFDGSEFRTARTNALFTCCRLGGKVVGVVTLTGFEPVLPA